MAVKKTDVKQEEEVIQEAAQEEPAGTDPFQETVEMIVPRKPRGEEQQYYVCVNDRRYAIPADGKMQKLPKPVAEILKDSLEADAFADDFADRMPKMNAEQPAIN